MKGVYLFKKRNFLILFISRILLLGEYSQTEKQCLTVSSATIITTKLSSILNTHTHIVTHNYLWTDKLQKSR